MGRIRVLELLEPAQWQQLQQEHQDRAEALTREHLRRRKAGETHPVWDFLFNYYPIKPAILARWHPGIGRALLIDVKSPPPHLDWRDYCQIETDAGPAVTADIAALHARRGESFEFIAELLRRTQDNPAHFDCFGLHEWAMVYRTEQPRHSLPLRLGPEGTARVVESHSIRCTHYDAFRFFTEPARPLNFRVLNRTDQVECEQRGCLHAGMDLYKWAYKLGPLVAGDIWLDAFELACDIRQLDMEASAYDCRSLGLGMVPIETPAGKAEYVTRQRALSDSAGPIRQYLINALDRFSVEAGS
ncbi:3-methyladenine DNA glycosylase [Corynebacterium sp. H128]|uniref:3-methyladenine DNA glycosylase n=1 Tax=Corynebacterium sp. H128 TaxID=3133427 RepID=UPI00403F5F1D